MTKNNEKIKQFTSKMGNQFTLQKVPAMTWLEIQERSAGAYGVRPTVIYPEVLKNIVVEPAGLKPDTFDDEPYGGTAEMREVVEAATTFQLGS